MTPAESISTVFYYAVSWQPDYGIETIVNDGEIESNWNNQNRVHIN